MRTHAFLLDVGYVMRHGRSALRLLLKEPEGGRTLRAYDWDFEPYFYVVPKETTEAHIQHAGRELSKLTAMGRGGEAKVKRVETEERILLGKKIRVLKAVCSHPSDVSKLREPAGRFGKTYEDDISFTKRYVIDRQLVPCEGVSLEYDVARKAAAGVKAEEIKGEMGLRMLGLDIETYNPGGMPDPAKDPCIMVGLSGEGGREVLTHSKKNGYETARAFATEKEMLESLGREMKRRKVDLLCTYNGDVFDLPYLRERAKATGAKMSLGRDATQPKSKQFGMRAETAIAGRVHFDVFPVVSLMNFIGAYKLDRLTLKVVYQEILGGKKEDVEKTDIWKIWDSDDNERLAHLAKYCQVDADAALQLSQKMLPLEVELSRVSGNTLFDTVRSRPGQLVEMLLMREAFRSGELIPGKPKGGEVGDREDNPVEGAYVKLPSPGLYENIAVLDFRSLYPSIIISHNIDPSTLNCSCCTEKEAHLSPKGHRFCKKKQGLIPRVLKRVLAERTRLKDEMKALKKKGLNEDSAEYVEAFAKQWALKILANSVYGYLLYSRSRYYSRECGESVTAWGRHYIMETLEKAGAAGLNPLYSDTDSTFLQFGKPGDEHKVEQFRKEINASLPEEMELELEDIYPRGIFVSKKQGEEKGAKKKYALINKDGKIKIRGFELVRRDWSRIAKETQRHVLKILLSEGDVDKAVSEVRKVVARLKEGKVPMEELVIYTQLKKKAKAYEIVSPEVSAFLKAQKAGLQVDEKSVIGYVITRQGKSISDRAQLIELAKDYDADYYVNNQVLPAVLRILGAMGFDEDDLKNKGKQSSLGDW
ncbi:MAG: DNA-directed DNA polymerase [Candidatus Micrarchaeota archaeon]